METIEHLVQGSGACRRPYTQFLDESSKMSGPLERFEDLLSSASELRAAPITRDRGSNSQLLGPSADACPVPGSLPARAAVPQGAHRQTITVEAGERRAEKAMRKYGREIHSNWSFHQSGSLANPNRFALA